MKFSHAIIDMDVLCYRCGFAIEKYDKEEEVMNVEPVHHAYYNINSMMNKILETAGVESYTGYLTSSGRDNFRFEIYPDYKSNRKNSRKPVYYNEIREFLQSKWNAEMITGQEADDACSIKQCELNSLGWDPEIKNSIVCSIDKDFNNIPGWHYNYVKEEIYYVTELEALKNFYLQILTGDAADGIPRIQKGYKQKKSEKAIRAALNESELYSIVFDEIYAILEKRFKDSDTLMENQLVRDEILLKGRLLWLRRKENEMWDLPKLSE